MVIIIVVALERTYLRMRLVIADSGTDKSGTGALISDHASDDGIIPDSINDRLNPIDADEYRTIYDYAIKSHELFPNEYIFTKGCEL